MNNLYIYAGLMLVKPLLTFIIRKTGLIGRGESDIPFFTRVHAISGRVRYRCELLHDSSFAEDFADTLKSVQHIKSVSVNSRTGSVLVTYSCRDEIISDIFSRLNLDLQKVAGRENSPVEMLFSLFKSVPKLNSVTGGRKALPAVSDKKTLNSDVIRSANGSRCLRESFFDSMSAISSHITKQTGGYFDLPSLIGAILIVRGMYKMFRYGQMPSGPQLIWWGYSFFKLRCSHEKVLPFRS